MEISSSEKDSVCYNREMEVWRSVDSIMRLSHVTEGGPERVENPSALGSDCFKVIREWRTVSREDVGHGG